MIIAIEPGSPESVVEAVSRLAAQYEGITPKRYVFQGADQTVTEVHLIGRTQSVPTEPFEAIPGVLRVVRVSARYRLIGRHGASTPGFEYNGVRFDEKSVQLFAGLCAVDVSEHVEATFRALRDLGLVTTRMGVYKPRTSPYDFQGLGGSCLPWLFDLAGKYGIRVIAMEVTDVRHVEEISKALADSGSATGVMLQIGTRNAQNFELLKEVGRQTVFPVLFKRGMGITLEESLNACEYVASEGNPNIVFCLRGVKTQLGDPHRNMVDFAHVPVVRRQTRLLVCIDPSHAVGRMDLAPDGLPDVIHAIGQGVIAGANMVLVDVHPHPEKALCDGPQALLLPQIPKVLAYIQRARAAYEEASSTMLAR